MIRRLAIALWLAAVAAAPALALTLELPAGAVETAQVREALGNADFPVSRYEAGEIETLFAEGPLTRRAWRIPGSSATTLQLLAPLRKQLEDAGYDILFECEAVVCGGFDFRFVLTVLPEPDMHVDLGDYRYLAAEGPDGSLVDVLVSRSATAGFIQITTVGAGAEIPVTATAPAASALPAPLPQGAVGSVGAQLDSQGWAILGDLVFRPGSSALGEGDFASLAELATWLGADPERRVILVGHTDTQGQLDANIVLSERRAQSVLGRLTDVLGVSATQLSARGVGYLAPRAPNTTPEGRAANRRVEVIRISP